MASMEQNTFEITELRNHPEWADRAAGWFHEKWKVPREKYRDSINECIARQTGVPQWYILLNDRQSRPIFSHLNTHPPQLGIHL